jgi:uncharacterized membrane protein
VTERQPTDNLSPYEYGVPAQPKVAGLAVASLVLGILGFFALPLVAPILALVFGYVALSQIKKANGWLTGRGMAIAGVVLGWLGLVTMIAVVVALALAMSGS